MAEPVAVIRLANLLLLSQQFDTSAAFAQAAGMSKSQLSQLVGMAEDGMPKSPLGEKLARKMETRLSLSPGWLDQPHTKKEGTGTRQAPPAPVTPLRPVASEPAPAATVSMEGLSPTQLALISVALELARKGKLPDHECIAVLARWQERVEKA
jgi:hypothetical protein